MVKRCFDIVFSIIGILFIVPLLLIIYLFVVLGSRGGFFYFQRRVGRNNRDFSLIKIRSMFTDSDKKGLLTIDCEDKRITPAGRFLRKYKLDELPQLFNIFGGSMSFVGPRPEVRMYVNMYTSAQQKVLQVKPGLTDFASLLFYDENKILSAYDDPGQVYIKVIMPRKLRLNLIYIKNQSLCLDIKIIFRTLFKWLP